MMKRVTFAALLLALPVLANEAGPLPAPTSATTVVARTARISYIRLVNSGGGTSVSCTFLDLTTNCGGSGCPIFKATFTADPQTYSDPQPRTLASGGFSVSCSGSGVTYYVQFDTP